MVSSCNGDTWGFPHWCWLRDRSCGFKGSSAFSFFSKGRRETDEKTKTNWLWCNLSERSWERDREKRTVEAPCLRGTEKTSSPLPGGALSWAGAAQDCAFLNEGVGVHCAWLVLVCFCFQQSIYYSRETQAVMGRGELAYTVHCDGLRS